MSSYEQERQARYDREMQEKTAAVKRMIKYGVGAVLGLFALGTLVSNTYIIDDKDGGARVWLGEVNQTAVVKPGLNFTVPFFEKIDVFNDIHNGIYEEINLSLPTRQHTSRPASGNLIVRYSITRENIPNIRAEYGTLANFEQRVIRQYIRSIVPNTTSGLEDTRTLMGEESRLQVQAEIQRRLIVSMEKTGVDIDAVLLQTIVPHEKVAEQMSATQERIEKEEAQKSETRRREIEAQVQVNEAKASREAAAETAEKARVEAQGRADSARIEAQGEADSIKIIAEANEELSKSLTPTIIRKMELENQRVLNERSTGQVPNNLTIVGETSIKALGIPIATTPSK